MGQNSVNGLNQGEAATDTFTHVITDPDNASDTATLVFNITGTNDAPDAVNVEADIRADDPAIGGDVMTNDTDIDRGDDPATGADVTVTSVVPESPLIQARAPWHPRPLWNPDTTT